MSQRSSPHAHGAVVVDGLQIAVTQIAAAPEDELNAAGVKVVVRAPALMVEPIDCAPTVMVSVRLPLLHTAAAANAPYWRD